MGEKNDGRNEAGEQTKKTTETHARKPCAGHTSKRSPTARRRWACRKVSTVNPTRR